MATEALDTATRVQSQLQSMQKNVERWQSQLGGLRGQDLGQVERDASSSGEPAALVLPGGQAVGDKALSPSFLQCPPWRRHCHSYWQN